MLSKRTKVCIGLLSLAIIGSLSTTALAATYSHQYTLLATTWSGTPPYGYEVFHFSVTAELTVKTKYSSGELVIYYYSGSYDFNSQKAWYGGPMHEFVSVDTDYTCTTIFQGLVIDVKYTVTGLVREIWNHNHYVWVSVWVKINAAGSTSQGLSYWSDHYGYNYRGEL